MSKDTAINLLANYFSGREVAAHSVGLSLEAHTMTHKRAREFFDLRNAFGVRGYADAEEATRAIKTVLYDDKET